MMQKFHIHRFELKYILPARYYAQIRKQLLLNMDYDPYSLKAEDYAYFVSSIYYDTPDNCSYFDKVDGVSERKKIRLRTYTADFSQRPDVYLEIKRKKSSVIIKDRARLAFGDYENILKFGMVSLLDNGGFPPDQFSVIKEACHDILKMRMNAQTRVSYRREAFFAKNFSNVRITLDSAIGSCFSHTLFPEAGRNFPILPSFTILELKFNSSLPKWVHGLIQEFNLERKPYSKYCASFQCLNKYEDSFLARRRLTCLMP